MKRRDFVKTMAISGMAVAASDLIGDLIAQTPQGKVLESKFKGLADIALAEAKSAGCSVRRHPLHARDQQRRERERRQPRLRGLRRVRRRRPRRWPWRRSRWWGRGGFGGFGGGGGGARDRGAAGFGIRVIHSGVWGFASSPIVTEDEIRRIARMATEVAKASAIAKRADVKLAPVPAYTDTGRARSRRIPPRCHRKRNRPTCRRSSISS